MAQETDKQVLDLVNLAKKKKAEISKAEKPDWKTNCSFGYVAESSQRMNIQTIADVDALVAILGFLLVQQSGYVEAAEALGVNSEFKWLGFPVFDWQTDIQTRINKIQINKKKIELDVLEQRLNKLISPELRTKLELEEITGLLEK